MQTEKLSAELCIRLILTRHSVKDWKISVRFSSAIKEKSLGNIVSKIWSFLTMKDGILVCSFIILIILPGSSGWKNDLT